MRKLWKALWNRRRFENDLAGELQFHIEARAADLQHAGHSPDELYGTGSPTEWYLQAQAWGTGAYGTTIDEETRFPDGSALQLPADWIPC